MMICSLLLGKSAVSVSLAGFAALFFESKDAS
jgi:hypothetical protein